MVVDVDRTLACRRLLSVYTCDPGTEVLITAGDQVPVIGGVLLGALQVGPLEWHSHNSGASCVKVGVLLLVTTTVNMVVDGAAHWPAAGDGCIHTITAFDPGR